MKKFIFFLFLPLILFAQANPGCVFLTIYPGARQVGMAGAFSAISDDAFATYYNPAGLAFQNNIDFSYYYTSTPWLYGINEDFNYYYLTFVIPITKKFGWGLFSNYHLQSDHTPYAPDYTVGFSLGYRILSNLGIGYNFKYIYSEIYNGAGKSIAFDFGLIYKIEISKFEINNAFVLQNLGPKISYIPGSEPDPLPYSIRIGSAFKLKHLYLLFYPSLRKENWLTKFLTENSYFLFTFDLRQDLYFESKPWLSFGLELPTFFIPPFYLRIGYFKDFENTYDGYAYTWSIGINLKFLKIDFGSYIHSTENWQFNISLNIGEPIFKGHIL